MLTTDGTEAALFRLAVEANERSGLRATCRLMVDKIATVPRTKIGARVGRLDDEDIMRLNQAMLVFLGLAVSPKTHHEARAGIAPGLPVLSNETFRPLSVGPGAPRSAKLATRNSASCR
ncbi:MAG: type II toxin-antitoxin system PemK/MazF family toxin [Acetobacteraceae bacterium]